jgi:hypothetical protein
MPNEAWTEYLENQTPYDEACGLLLGLVWNAMDHNYRRDGSLADALSSHFDGRIPKPDDLELRTIVSACQQEAAEREPAVEVSDEWLTRFVIDLLTQSSQRRRPLTTGRPNQSDVDATIDAALRRVLGGSRGKLSATIQDRCGGGNFGTLEAHTLADRVGAELPGVAAWKIRDRVRDLRNSNPHHPRARLG